jgi:hypothetical protein
VEAVDRDAQRASPEARGELVRERRLPGAVDAVDRDPARVRALDVARDPLEQDAARQ